MAQIVTQLIVDSSGAKLGVAEFEAAMGKAKKAAVDGGEATATSFERAQARWTASLAKTDPVIKAQIAMEKDLARQREISANAVKLGIASQDAAGAQIEKVRQQHQAYIATLGGVGAATQQMAAKTGLARHELINLGRQAQDVAVSLYGGQSPLTVLAQQGTQIADVFSSSGGTVRGFFGQVGAGAAALITPVNATVAAAVALSAAAAAAALQMDRLQVSSQKALGGAGGRTGTTVSDLNQFTSQNSGISGTGLSNKEARALGEDFTKTGEIVISRLRGMSDAVVGFSNQTGQSMSEASKAMVGFATDPKKALDELSKTYGNFDIATRKAVDALVQADDKTGAFQVVIDALSEKSKKAADNMGFFEKAARSVVNVLATEATSPRGLEGQLAAAQEKLAQEGNGAARSTGSTARLRKEIEDLQSAIDKVNAQKAAAELNKLSTAADGAAKALIPQIDQIDQLKIKIGELERAMAGGATSKYGSDVDNAALQAAQNQLAALRESQAEASRYNQQVALISQSWGNVGQAVALQLNMMQNALPVAQAWTEATRMRAQEETTYLNLIQKGLTIEEASAVAAKEYELSKAAAVANAQKLVQSSEDNLDKIRAQGTGMEGLVDSSIAYRDAIQGGATAMQANVIAANALEAAMIRAAQAAQQMQQSVIDAANHTTNGIVTAASFGGPASQSGSFAIGPGGVQGNGWGWDVGGEWRNVGASSPSTIANEYVGRGDYAGAIRAIQQMTGAQSRTGTAADITADQIAQVDTLTQLMNSMTSNKNVQAANLQSEVDWLNKLPQTIARDQKIVSLMQSIDQLKDSTDSLTSVNQDLLSPYYSQDPRTSHIGFRSQGMATGGEFTVPGGYSANDNMIAQIPVASGEIVQVRRPGQNLGGSVVNVVNNINVSGNVDKKTVNAIGRTAYQETQSAAKNLAAAR